MSTRTSNNLKKTVSPLEALAWTAMTEDEFVERLAAKVWKCPADHSLKDGGRVGVSQAKTKRFMAALGKHFSPRERKRIAQRVFKRSQELFEQACRDWAIQALELSQTDDFEARIKNAVSLVAPRGARGPTLDLIHAKMAEYEEKA